jgi:hypothetical protein
VDGCEVVKCYTELTDPVLQRQLLEQQMQERQNRPLSDQMPGGGGLRGLGGEGGAAAALGIAATPSRPFRLNGFGTPSPTAASARLALHQPSTGTRNEPRRTSPA